MSTVRITRLPLRRFAALALLAALPLAGQAATVTPILAYSFDQGELFRSQPDLLAPGLVAEAWVSAGSVATSTTGNPGRALSANGWNGDGNAFVLRVRLAPGHTLALSGFGFDERASGTGATAWQLSIADVTVASGPTHTVFTRHAGLINLPGSLSGQFDVVLSGFGASSGSGTWRMDNFFLEGEVHSAGALPATPTPTPVPLPAGGLLFTAPTLLLTACRRLRKASPGGYAEAPARQLRQPPSSGK
jgi:hypothetical protein